MGLRLIELRVPAPCVETRLNAGQRRLKGQEREVKSPEKGVDVLWVEASSAACLRANDEAA